MVLTKLFKRSLVISLLTTLGFSGSSLSLNVWSQETPAFSTNPVYVSFNPASAPTDSANLLQNATSALASRVTVRNSSAQSASVFIDFNEVIKLNGPVGKRSAHAEALQIQEALRTFLDAGGSARDIQPGLNGKNVVVRGGKSVLLTIDAKQAAKSGLTSRQLAYQWSNLIRQSLGFAPARANANWIASRGFSPVVDALRNHEAPAKAAAVRVLRTLRGNASWYGPGFNGRRSANGERFNMNGLTAAHRSLPFNTRVRVTNSRNGRTAIVRITDRGPFCGGRVMDLSKGAASAIGMISSGTAPIVVEVLGR